MKLSKHLHSCLLIEDQGKTILIDPGIFTYQENALDIHNLQRIDYLLFTHEHPDHMHLPLVKEIVAKFPDVKIVTNQSIVEILKNANIQVSSSDDEIVKLESVPHEKLWDKEPPENVMVTVFSKLSDPGDSLHFDHSAEILALPITAPWGSTKDAVDVALKLHPKYIVPVHDWMYKDDVRKMMYQRLKEFFKTKGITFLPLETGEVVEV